MNRGRFLQTFSSAPMIEILPFLGKSVAVIVDRISSAAILTHRLKEPKGHRVCKTILHLSWLLPTLPVGLLSLVLSR